MPSARILIHGYEHSARDLLFGLLETLGHQPVLYPEKPGEIRRLGDSAFDAVIMRGNTASAETVDLNWNFPIILVFESPGEFNPNLRLRSFDQCAKFNAAELHWAIRLALAKYKAHKELASTIAEIERSCEDTLLGAVVLDPAGNVLQADSQAASLMGLKIEDVIGRDFQRLFAPKLRLQRILRRLTSKAPLNIELPGTIGKNRTKKLSAKLKPVNEDKVICILRASGAADAIQSTNDSPHDIVLTIDLEGSVTTVNGAIEPMLGHKQQDVLQMDMRKLIAPNYSHIAERNMKLKLDGNVESTVYELPVLAKDGSIVWYEIESRLIRDNGSPIGVHGIARGINAGKKAEQILLTAHQDLLNSEELHRTLVQTIPHGVAEIDLKGKITFANEAASTITEFSREELIGQFIWDLVGKDPVAKKNLELLFCSIVSNHPVPSEIVQTIQTKTGSLVSIETAWDYKRNASGEVEGFILVATDVSERKKAEEALKAGEEKYRLLVENAPLAIISCDIDGRITEANREALTMLGVGEIDQARQFNLLQLRHIRNSGIAEALQKCLTAGAKQAGEFPYASPLGKLQLKLHLAPIFNSDNQIIGAQGIIEDVTEIRKAQESLLQTERYKAVADLAAGIAHNFNNLLQVILGGAQLGIMDIDSGNFEHLKKSLGYIVESCKSGAETVRRLQTFAGLNQSFNELPHVVFDLSVLAGQAVEMSRSWIKMESHLSDREIAIDVDFAKSCFVHAKKHEILEVLINLIKNAYEAMPNGGGASIKTSLADSNVVFAIKDTGVGLSRQSLKRVFNPFFTTKSAPGTGLGLASCRKIISDSGGQIFVDSELGAGATFTMVLPFTDPSVNKAGADSANEEY